MQERRKIVQPGDAREQSRAELTVAHWRADSAFDISFEIETVAVTGHPLHQIHQVRRDIGNAFTLFLGIEVPGRPLQRLSVHSLCKMMDAANGDGGLIAIDAKLAEYRRLARKRALQRDWSISWRSVMISIASGADLR